MLPVIVCIAKGEKLYIEEFVKYHLSLGFDFIFVYDNENKPTYQKILSKFGKKVKVIWFPGNNFSEGVQYVALKHFFKFFIPRSVISHILHIDIDEFVSLKKHGNIKDFIVDYIGGNCGGIGINWRIFGDSNHNNPSLEPVTCRFTKCAKQGDIHIKTLFRRDVFKKFLDCHSVEIKEGYHIFNTKRQEIIGSFNNNIDQSVIQINHYKSKTWPEFQNIRKRGRADFNFNNQPRENIKESFDSCNINEVEDLTAKNFYQNLS